jgi:hypothetical protein
MPFKERPTAFTYLKGTELSTEDLSLLLCRASYKHPEAAGGSGNKKAGSLYRLLQFLSGHKKGGPFPRPPFLA